MGTDEIVSRTRLLDNEIKVGALGRCVSAVTEALLTAFPSLRVAANSPDVLHSPVFSDLFKHKAQAYSVRSMLSVINSVDLCPCKFKQEGGI